MSRWHMHKPKDKTTYKRSVTVKPYTVKYYRDMEVTVPAGSVVDNQTACGCDDNYRFWTDWHKTIPKEQGMLRHDLEYYGLRVPAEYCQPYVP